MKLLFFILLCSFIAHYAPAQEALSHDIAVSVDARHRAILVHDSMCIDFQGKDSLSLVLWKNTQIHSITLGHVPATYTFDTSSPSPIMYIPNGRKLVIVNSNPRSGVQSLSFDYRCDMKYLRGWAKSFSDSWIELNFYSAWFPVCLTGNNFSSRIAIAIDSTYVVGGSGIVTPAKTGWHMVQPWSSYDNVIVASPHLKNKVLRSGDATIEVDYTDFPESAADSVIAECGYALRLYEKLFGAIDTTYLKFVVTPVEKGGGYSRRNFVSLGTRQFDLYTRTGIGHELAHFWWRNAGTSTWEDWLNESFSEYSMLVYLRERLGEDVFRNQKEEYESHTVRTPPIWGIARNDTSAYNVLYEKGALILCETENKVGRDRFFDLLREVSSRKIRTTAELLDLVDVRISKNVRSWLETELRTR